MNKPKILLTRHIELFKNLASHYPQFTLEMPSEDDLEPLKRDLSQYQGIISTLADPISTEVFESAKNLKVISNYAVGYNNIDTESAKKRNILVGNTPDTLTHSTAELALTLLMMGARRTNSLQNKVKSGNWIQWEPEVDNGFDLREKCLGIIGFGRIGQAFAKMAYDLWKVEIFVWPRKSAHNQNLSFPYHVVNEQEFFERVQILSLHCPLNESTKEIINSKFIEQMKNPFHFVNTARGGCHKEDDLLKAINQKKILSCGLDVTNPEPMKQNSPLLQNEVVTVLPHIGSATDRTRKEMVIQCLDNIKAGIKGEKLPFQVN